MTCCGPPKILCERRDTLISKCEIPIIDLGHMGKFIFQYLFKNYNSTII